MVNIESVEFQEYMHIANVFDYENMWCAEKQSSIVTLLVSQGGLISIIQPPDPGELTQYP